MFHFRREWLFALLIALFCTGLVFLDLAPRSDVPTGLHARARVTAVDNSQVRTNLIVKTEAQFLTVVLLSGPHRSQTLTIENMLTGKMEFDEFYAPGDTLLVEYDTADGRPRHGVARGRYRLGTQLFLISPCSTGRRNVDPCNDPKRPRLELHAFRRNLFSSPES